MVVVLLPRVVRLRLCVVLRRRRLLALLVHPLLNVRWKRFGHGVGAAAELHHAGRRVAEERAPLLREQ